MPTNAIVATTAAANSSDIPVTAGSTVTVGVYTAAGGTPAFTLDEAMPITRKNAGGTYDATGLSITPQQLHVRLDSPGTFRVEKPVTRAALGVNQD